jgi:hypothetical protein
VRWHRHARAAHRRLVATAGRQQGEQYRQRRIERQADAPDTIPAGEAIELDLPPPASAS